MVNFTSNDINIRRVDRVGRITLTRPDALNALTQEMSIAVEAALDAWRDDPEILMVVMDSEGDKAFCAGGDIAQIYASGSSGDYAFGQNFWRQEYRMNMKMALFPKPVLAFLQGFTMGGGVGLACHCSHRVVCESSKIAMPECGIGLVPDVGGSFLLANAPGALGEYLGVTGTHMNASDAIYCGFADYILPLEKWDDTIAKLEELGDIEALYFAHLYEEPSAIERVRDGLSKHFEKASLAEIVESLEADDDPLSERTVEAMKRASPLSMAATIEMVRAARGRNLLEAFKNEFRFTYRAQEHADLLEGIRALIIDKDKNPNWKHTIASITQRDVDVMLQPLGDAEWREGGR